MAKFDPKNPPEQAGGGSIPAGEHLMVIRWLENADNQKGRQWKLKVEVISGSKATKGKKAHLWLTKPSEKEFAARAQILIKKLGIEDPFDDDDTNESMRALRGKPFKASTTLVQSGEYTNVRLGKIMDMTPAEEVLAETWVAEEAERREMEGNGSSDDEDGFVSAPPKGKRQREPGDDDGDIDFPSA